MIRVIFRGVVAVRVVVSGHQKKLAYPQQILALNLRRTPKIHSGISVCGYLFMSFLFRQLVFFVFSSVPGVWVFDNCFLLFVYCLFRYLCIYLFISVFGYFLFNYLGIGVFIYSSNSLFDIANLCSEENICYANL